MLAVHCVNVTPQRFAMAADRGAKVASVVLCPAETGLRVHGCPTPATNPTPPPSLRTAGETTFCRLYQSTPTR